MSLDPTTSVDCGNCGQPVHSTLTDQCPHCGADGYGYGTGGPETRKLIVDGVEYRIPPGYELIAEGYAEKAKAALALLQDLDRSEHGRHEGDSEFQTEGGVSLGNRLLPAGTHIGHHISGRRIVVPSWHDLGNPEAWIEPPND
jgi:hypothetical protein